MNDIFVNEILKIWMDGGALMIPLAILGFIIYFAIAEVWDYLRSNNFFKTDPNTWEAWLERPDDGEGQLGDMISYLMSSADSETAIRRNMDEIRSAYLPQIDRRIQYAAILIGAAPLTGLLGTVVGMLSTFEGLALGGAGNTVDMVAGGISEALITTQTGLVLAIPGYVMLNSLRKTREELYSFFIELEIRAIQQFKRNLKRTA